MMTQRQTRGPQPVALACALWLLGLLAVAGPTRAGGPVYWDMPAGRSFAECRLEGATVLPGGFLAPGIPLLESRPLDQEVVWTVVDDGRGGYYAGTGHQGEILHLAADGGTTVLVAVEGAEVFSLLRIRDGSLLAGCGPDGQLWRIDPASGAADLQGLVPGGYVWAMAEAADGGVWLAAGSPAALYRWKPQGGLALVAELPAENALDVRQEEGGRILVCTQGPGLVYAVDPDRPDRPRLLLQTDQTEARRIIPGPQGRSYVLALAAADEEFRVAESDLRQVAQASLPRIMTAMQAAGAEEPVPRAALYSLPDREPSRRIWFGDVDLMFAVWEETLGWIGAGALGEQSGLARLLRLDPPAGATALTAWEGGDVLDILVSRRGDGPVLAVAQAHPGRVDLLGEAGGRTGQALGPVLDGGTAVQWSRLSWTGDRGRDGPRWSVRCGDIAAPDESWTGWSDEWEAPDRALDLPASRFLQWRVRFPNARPTPEGQAAAGRVATVSVSGWRPNRPPVIQDFVREETRGSFLGPMMNHRDNVTLSFRSGLKAEFSRGDSERRDPPAGRQRLGDGVVIFSWKASDPDGDRLDHALEYRLVGEAAWREAASGSGRLIEGWETRGLSDGDYEVRLVLDDGPDNPPGNVLRAERILGPFRVDNTPPAIQGLTARAEQDGIALRFGAEDRGGRLAEAGVVLPDGSRQRLDPEDRVCDAEKETFRLTVPWPAVGERPRWVRIQVRDLAGNLAESECEIQ